MFPPERGQSLGALCMATVAININDSFFYSTLVAYSLASECFVYVSYISKTYSIN